MNRRVFGARNLKKKKQLLGLSYCIFTIPTFTALISNFGAFPLFSPSLQSYSAAETALVAGVSQPFQLYQCRIEPLPAHMRLSC